MVHTVQYRLTQLLHLEIQAKFVTESSIIPDLMKSALIDEIDKEKMIVLQVIGQDIHHYANNGENRPLADLLQDTDGRFYAIDPVTGCLYFDIIDMLQDNDGRVYLWDRENNWVNPRLLTIFFAWEIPVSQE